MSVKAQCSLNKDISEVEKPAQNSLEFKDTNFIAFGYDKFDNANVAITGKTTGSEERLGPRIETLRSEQPVATPGLQIDVGETVQVPSNIIEQAPRAHKGPKAPPRGR